MPKEFACCVPEMPGTYAIYQKADTDFCNAVVDIGEAGPRAGSSPKGLRGRLATGVAHSASETMAADIQRGDLVGDLMVVWIRTGSKRDAKQLQDALLTLFRNECGRQPKYNRRQERHPTPESYMPEYVALKRIPVSRGGRLTLR